jgi:hypothetical protein
MGRLGTIFAAVFGAFGLVMLAVAAYTAHSTLSFRESASSAEGSVVAIDGGRPVVEFVDSAGASHRVVGTVSSNPPAYDVGERVTVWHRPDRPDDARIDGFLESWFLPTLFGGLGTVFGSIGAGFWLSALRKRRLHAWLRQFGMRIQAKYTGVMLDTSVRINGRHPWRLTAQWQHPATGVVHTFESDALYFDPTDFVKRETVEVWVDTQDPRRHHLDTAFLPRHAGS